MLVCFDLNSRQLFDDFDDGVIAFAVEPPCLQRFLQFVGERGARQREIHLTRCFHDEFDVLLLQAHEKAG